MNNFKKVNIISVLLTVVFTSALANASSTFPELSLRAQQIHTQKRMFHFQQLMRSPKNLVRVEHKLRQALGHSGVQLFNSLKKIYILNDFQPIWKDKEVQKIFLKDYAIFVASGISPKSSIILNQILASKEGSFKRDILLTDGFLDYFYYTQNVRNHINLWLYESKSYSVKPVEDDDLVSIVNRFKDNGGYALISELIPSKNKRYTDIVNALLNGQVINSQVSKLALNAQRLREIPNFENGLYVNIPSYKLNYYKDGELILNSVVVVGRKERPTPVLFSKLSDVVINPPWTIPPTILKEDVIPKYSKDPNYGARKGFEILDYRGNTISQSDVEWANYQGDDADKFPYLVRQKPGKTAALGRYKFNMPSADAIFLHDTPHKGVFSRKYRALSSGCIRVQKASQLSSILLKEVGWSEEEHKKVFNSEKTKHVRIGSSVPVYLYYITSWIENGKLYKVSDTYHLDTGFKKGFINWNILRTQL